MPVTQATDGGHLSLCYRRARDSAHRHQSNDAGRPRFQHGDQSANLSDFSRIGKRERSTSRQVGFRGVCLRPRFTAPPGARPLEPVRPPQASGLFVCLGTIRCRCSSLSGRSSRQEEQEETVERALVGLIPTQRGAAGSSTDLANSAWPAARPDSGSDYYPQADRGIIPHGGSEAVVLALLAAFAYGFAASHHLNPIRLHGTDPLGAVPTWRGEACSRLGGCAANNRRPTYTDGGVAYMEASAASSGLGASSLTH